MMCKIKKYSEIYDTPRISEVMELQFPLLLANYKITTTDLGNILTSSMLQWGTLGPSIWTNTNTNISNLTSKYLKSTKNTNT